MTQLWLHQSFPLAGSQNNSREEDFPGQGPGEVCEEPRATVMLVAGITQGLSSRAVWGG